VRTISSAETLYLKFIFPPFWIGGFKVFTLSLFLSPGSWQGADGGPPDPVFKWSFLLATIVGAVLIQRTCIRLKRVRMDDTALEISSYASEIVVPLAEVAAVFQNHWLDRPSSVTLVFRLETPFGYEIVFMPKIRWFNFWTPHPVVEEIRAAVSRSTGRAPGAVRIP